MQEYVVEPVKDLGLDEVAVRTLLIDHHESMTCGGYPGDIGFLIWFRFWASLDLRLKEDQCMLRVFEGVTAIEKATGKEKCLHTVVNAAFDQMQSVCRKQSI